MIHQFLQRAADDFGEGAFLLLGQGFGLRMEIFGELDLRSNHTLILQHIKSDVNLTSHLLLAFNHGLLRCAAVDAFGGEDGGGGGADAFL